MVPWHIVTAKALSGFRLDLRFADGVAGIVGISPEELTGVLAPLADPELFAQAGVVNGVVVWPNGLDIAPDALYDEVVAQQRQSA